MLPAGVALLQKIQAVELRVQIARQEKMDLVDRSEIPAFPAYLSKMCFFAGHDFYVMGTLGNSTSGAPTFTPLDPWRNIGSDPWDFGGSMFAGQTFTGRDGQLLTMSWVLEGDCDIEAVPPACPDMLQRGWEGVHSLPRVITVEKTPPPSSLK